MRKSAMMSLVILTMTSFVSLAGSIEKEQTTPPAAMVWFDGSGAYHYSDPIPYLNDVLSGKKKDSEIHAVLSTICKDRMEIVPKDLPLIAAAMNPLTQTAAFYPDDSQFITAGTKRIREHFASSAAATGSLSVKSFGFMAQGDSSRLTGVPDSNLLLAIPADPGIVSKATTHVDDSGLRLEKVLLTGADSPEWSGYAQRIPVGIAGMSMLFNLKPGPWIIYLNQKDLITQCYRVIIPVGTNKELIAEDICVPPRKQFSMKVDEKQGS
ncbi:hypothetical protein JW823_03925 [bacterium]|nr:hypothetical protein [candidate division CSSED10-310 bacterium]